MVSSFFAVAPRVSLRFWIVTPKIITEGELKDIFDSESEDLETDLEESGSASASVRQWSELLLKTWAKDLQKKGCKMEILLGKVAKHVGLAEDDLTTIMVQLPCKFPYTKEISGRPILTLLSISSKTISSPLGQTTETTQKGRKSSP